jgi:hypothetical protein
MGHVPRVVLPPTFQVPLTLPPDDAVLSIRPLAVNGPDV